jgi:pimeloyl-ACP methyl ester carboxylesterase
MRMDHSQLTAMGAYLRLFDHWTPRPVTAPILFVHPEDSTPDFPQQLSTSHIEAAPRNTKYLSRTVPGDHFTMMDQHAEATALCVDAWLTETFPHAAAGTPEPRKENAMQKFT